MSLIFLGKDIEHGAVFGGGRLMGVSSFLAALNIIVDVLEEVITEGEAPRSHPSTILTHHTFLPRSHDSLVLLLSTIADRLEEGIAKALARLLLAAAKTVIPGRTVFFILLVLLDICVKSLDEVLDRVFTLAHLHLLQRLLVVVVRGRVGLQDVVIEESDVRSD